MPYTVKNDINGLAAKNKDAKDFSSKIQFLMGNKNLRAKLQNGIEKTVKQLKTKEDFEAGVRLFFKSISL
jgi:hypothetical protein